jgi:hypothetical protein
VRKVIVLTTVAMALLVSPAGAVTLITPQGAPLPGPWQAWANEARMPTGGYQLAIVASAGCGPTAFCSIGPVPPMGTPATPYATSLPDLGMPPNSLQDHMLFELGHQVDWHLLTAADRERLAALWKVRGVSWWDSAAAITVGAEDGLEGVFAGVYTDCALGQPAMTPWETAWPGGFTSPSADVKPDQCVLIAHMLGGEWRPLRGYRWLLDPQDIT